MENEDEKVMVKSYSKSKGYPRNYRRTGLELLWKKVFKVRDYRGAIYPSIPYARKHA